MASCKLTGLSLTLLIGHLHIATSARVRQAAKSRDEADAYMEDAVGIVKEFVISNSFSEPSMTDEGVITAKSNPDGYYTVQVELDKVPHFSDILQAKITPDLTPEDAKTLDNGQDYVPIELDGEGNVDLAGFLGNSVLTVQAIQTIKSSKAVRFLKAKLSKIAGIDWREAKEDELFHIGAHNTQTDGDLYTGFAHFHYIAERQFTDEERDKIIALVNKYHKYDKK